MEVTAKVLAERIGGTIEGPTDVTLNQIAKIEDAGEGSLTFLANMEYEGFIYTTRASAALVSEHFAPSQELPKQLALIRVQDPYTAFAGVLQWAAASGIIPQEYLPRPTSTPLLKSLKTVTSDLLSWWKLVPKLAPDARSIAT